MEEKSAIVNRVASSPLISVDLEDYIAPGERTEIDLKNLLFESLILREKDFREYVSNHDWSDYQDKNVAVYCSTDAIIPSWAYMLITSKLQPYASVINYGSRDDLDAVLIKKAISEIDIEVYRDKKVVIKGCSKKNIPESAYIEVTRLLTPVVSSIMFGEPCSTIPVYKQKKERQ